MQWGGKSNNLTWQQQKDVFFFLVCNLMLLIVYFLLPTNIDSVMQVDTDEIEAVVAELELIKKQQDSIKRIPVKYPFNPNYITEYHARIFSIDSITLNVLLNYRSQGKWINSITDFQTVSGWGDSKMEQIQDYLQFPEWVQNTSILKKEKSIDKKDINKATKEDLMEVPGIGEILSERILEWQNSLSGYAHPLQLNHVYGLNDNVRKNIWNYFYIVEKPVYPCFDINAASASDLATIPGVTFEEARKIWTYQHLREGIDDIKEIHKIDGIHPAKLELIALYLYAN